MIINQETSKISYSAEASSEGIWYVSSPLLQELRNELVL